MSNVKELYFNLSDNVDVSKLTMSPINCLEYIKSDIEYSKECNEPIKSYTLTPIWLTDKQILKLPEYEF